MTASPNPRVVPESPTCAAIDLPVVPAAPKVLATSPSAAVAPNCANPAAMVSPAAVRIAGCRQPCSVTGRGVPSVGG